MEAVKKILVVDDDPYLLMSLEYLMKKNGYEVLIARNGTEALTMADQQPPDVILLDIMMPDVDGDQICQHVKTSKKLQQAKIVFVNATTQAQEFETGARAGASLYITKPFSPRKLVKQITALLVK